MEARLSDQEPSPDRQHVPHREPVRDASEPARRADPNRGNVVPLKRSSEPDVVSFDRHELRQIMNVYGRKVAEGEWRDYAIDFTPHRAIFSIFRRTSEVPLFRIEKDPKLARKQGAYSVVAAGGMILKRGQDLARVIEVLDRRVKLVGV
jgi:hypothetical protein